MPSVALAEQEEETGAAELVRVEYRQPEWRACMYACRVTAEAHRDQLRERGFLVEVQPDVDGRHYRVIYHQPDWQTYKHCATRTVAEYYRDWLQRRGFEARLMSK